MFENGESEAKECTYIRDFLVVRKFCSFCEVARNRGADQDIWYAVTVQKV